MEACNGRGFFESILGSWKQAASFRNRLKGNQRGFRQKAGGASPPLGEKGPDGIQWLISRTMDKFLSDF